MDGARRVVLIVGLDVGWWCVQIFGEVDGRISGSAYERTKDPLP
jgi:hypothetical protein